MIEYWSSLKHAAGESCAASLRIYSFDAAKDAISRHLNDYRRSESERERKENAKEKEKNIAYSARV